MKNMTLKAILSLRKRVRREFKMLPLDKKGNIMEKKFLPNYRSLLTTLKLDIQKIVILCMNKIGGISGRLRIAHNFIQFIMKMTQNHGPKFTVKWLKACAVALQKWRGGDNLSSLREIEKDLPLPRLINGCPSIINRLDRNMMRNGNPNLFRFWHSLFSLYRIISIPGELKLETITAPFNGNQLKLGSYNGLAYSWTWPKSISDLALKQNLAPRDFHLSSKASPSNSTSYLGILTDIALFEHPSSPLNNMMNYLNAIGVKWNVKPFIERFRSGVDIVSSLEWYNLPHKENFTLPFGQLSIKKEAAGKLRVFALVDSISQTVLKPLHNGLFAVLRALPNDGTFDQDAAVLRCQKKAIKFGCAYSYDLSAATDRLPVILTGNVLDSLFQINFGHLWSKFLVDRDFAFSDDPTNIRYAVGQPMGALSSWAGLAITHHWIAQLSSNLAGYSYEWDDRYEVLGDDIVIFDRRLADSYLEVMKDIGVEINLSKSIVSHYSPVFEFAKRTSYSTDLISGLNFSQVRAGVTLSSRVANLFQWVRLKLVTAPSVMEFYLTNFSKLDKNNNSIWQLSVGTLGLFSLFVDFYNKERKTVLDAVVNPLKGVEYNMEDHLFGVPVRQLLSQIINFVNDQDVVPLSKYEDRREWTEENEPFIAATILQTALYKSRSLTSVYMDNMAEMANSLVKQVSSMDGFIYNTNFLDFCQVKLDFNIIPREISPLQISQIQGWFEENFNPSMDPYELEDEVEKLNIFHAKTSKVTLIEAYSLLDKVEKFEFHYSKPVSKGFEYDSMSTPILKDMVKGPFLSGSSYWEVLSPNMELYIHDDRSDES